MTDNAEKVSNFKLIMGGTKTVYQFNDHPRSSAEQLNLPFEDSAKLVFIHESEALSQSTSFLEKYQPRWIFDVRIAPRLDFIANSRVLAFQRMRQLDVDYIDVLARFGIWSDNSKLFESDYWKECISILSKSSKRCGPYIFIFDDDHTLCAARRTLPEVMQNCPSIP